MAKRETAIDRAIKNLDIYIEALEHAKTILRQQRTTPRELKASRPAPVPKAAAQ